MSKKGDIVAVMRKRVTSWNGAGGPSNPVREEWTLMRVWSATRDGAVKKLQEAGNNHGLELKHMHSRPCVFSIRESESALAKVAAELFEQAGKDRDTLHLFHWDSRDALKAALKSKLSS